MFTKSICLKHCNKITKFAFELRFKGTTINKEEILKFDRLASEWWDKYGSLKALHSMNDIRVPFIRDSLLESTPKECTQLTSKPLKSFKIIDVGCGGGILAEPLNRLGADVYGIDASRENIEVAKIHAKLDDNLNIQYQWTPIENIVEERHGMYDTLVASEVVEHVDDLPMFIKSCSMLLKHGAQLFFTTINRTFMSHALAIFAAEYVFNLVPRGTHEWNMFVKPEELKGHCENNGLKVKTIRGMTMNPFNNNWSWTTCDYVNYAMHVVKE